MSIQDYFIRQEQKRANEKISELCLKQKHKEIAKKISNLIKGN